MRLTLTLMTLTLTFRRGPEAARPDTDLVVGQVYYATDTHILYIYSNEAKWEASTAHPRLEEDLNMQDLYQVKNLVAGD